jgi:hypothetical protein
MSLCIADYSDFLPRNEFPALLAAYFMDDHMEKDF